MSEALAPSARGFQGFDDRGLEAVRHPPPGIAEYLGDQYEARRVETPGRQRLLQFLVDRRAGASGLRVAAVVVDRNLGQRQHHVVEEFLVLVVGRLVCE